MIHATISANPGRPRKNCKRCGAEIGESGYPDPHRGPYCGVMCFALQDAERPAATPSEKGKKS